MSACVSLPVFEVEAFREKRVGRRRKRQKYSRKF
jgi:hypothetical protein